MDNDQLAFLEKPADHNPHCSSEKPADHDPQCLHVTGETIVVNESMQLKTGWKTQLNVMRGSRNFHQGVEGEWFILKKTIILQVSRGGPIIFRGGGSGCLFPIETHISLDFPWMRGSPLSATLDLCMNVVHLRKESQIWGCP